MTAFKVYYLLKKSDDSLYDGFEFLNDVQQNTLERIGNHIIHLKTFSEFINLIKTTMPFYESKQRDTVWYKLLKFEVELENIL